MVNNYLHKYKLTISKPPTINTIPQAITPETGSSQVVDKEGDYRTITRLAAIELTDLSLKARITSTKNKGSKTPVQLTITGFNQEVVSYVDKNSIVILEGGYEDNPKLPVLFVGQVITKDIDYSQDIPIMKITCSDSYTPSSAVKISKEFPSGSTTYEDVLDWLMSVYTNNGIAIGRPLSNLENKQGVGTAKPLNELTLPKGYSIPPMFLDKAMDKVCKEVGYTYYFDRSQLFVEPENYVSETTKQFTLQANQIISVSDIVPTNNVNSKDKQESTVGKRIKTLLDGRFEIGNIIQANVEGFLRGTYKIVSIAHDMDYEGNSWYTIMEVQSV